jgi:hypothetical protein
MAMTALLQQALGALETLPAAAHLLDVLDERRWDRQFAATTPAQWARVMTRVRAEIPAGHGVPMSAADWEV